MEKEKEKEIKGKIAATNPYQKSGYMPNQCIKFPTFCPHTLDGFLCTLEGSVGNFMSSAHSQSCANGAWLGWVYFVIGCNASPLSSFQDQFPSSPFPLLVVMFRPCRNQSAFAFYSPMSSWPRVLFPFICQTETILLGMPIRCLCDVPFKSYHG